MNKLYIVMLAAALAACTFKVESTPNIQQAVVPVDIPSIGVTAGAFKSNNDTILVRSITVNGTDCIWIGNYKSSSLSCNWKQ